MPEQEYALSNIYIHIAKEWHNQLIDPKYLIYGVSSPYNSVRRVVNTTYEPFECEQVSLRL